VDRLPADLAGHRPLGAGPVRGSTLEPGTAAWRARRLADADRPRRPRTDGLTLDRILDAALELVDKDGLDGLTMRRLAGHLGCGHASLYRDVDSHQEVVVLLADRVLGTITLDGRGAAPHHRRLWSLNTRWQASAGHGAPWFAS
jgi:AcrR family transcriptional regulator